MLEIIQRIKFFFKSQKNNVILAIAVFLIAVISFGLGIFLSRQEKTTPIILEGVQLNTRGER